MSKLDMGFFKYFGIIAFLTATEVPVFGLNFTISKDQVIIGSTGTITMSCEITELDVETIYLIQIRRINSTMLSGTDFPEWETLAFMELVSNESPTLSSDIMASTKDYFADGTWNSVTPTSTYLTLSMNTSKLECHDAREYLCELAYKSKFTSAVKKFEMNGTFSAYVKPRVISLIARRNGLIVQGTSNLSDTVSVDVGDELELNCTANIGGLPETIIRWNISSKSSVASELDEYRATDGTFDDGTAISDNQCGYIRTGSIKYNITTSDVHEAYYLVFECYVREDKDPYGSFVTQNNPRFYFDVKTTTTPKSTASTSIETDKITTELTNLSTATSTTQSHDVTTVETLNAENKEDGENMPLGIIVGTSTVVLIVGIVVTLVVLRRKATIKGRSQAGPESRSEVQHSLPKSHYESVHLGTLETSTYDPIQ